MSYIIYRTIKEEEFNNLHKRINNLRAYFETYLGEYGFKLTNKNDLSDILGLDFIYRDQKYNGNIGFLFDDKGIASTFTFYVTKSFDIKSKRYFRRVNVLENVDLNYIETNMRKILEKSIYTYTSLRDDQLSNISKINR